MLFEELSVEMCAWYSCHTYYLFSIKISMKFNRMVGVNVLFQEIQFSE